MLVMSTGGRNVRAGRLLGGGLLFSDARARMGDITLEGAAAIQVIGGALPKLTDRGVIGPDDFPYSASCTPWSLEASRWRCPGAHSSAARQEQRSPPQGRQPK
jgi:hypothetical protein